MKKILPAIIILIILVLGLLTAFHPEKYLSFKEVPENLAGNVENNVVVLNFIPQPVTELVSLGYDNTWSLLSNKIVTNIAGVEQILVNFYQVDDDQIKLILQDRHGFYDLGFTLEGEPEGVTVLAEDVNGDGALELVIMADQGAAYREVKIFTFDGANWLCLLSAHNLTKIDLNNDGREELVATSMGSLPGYVWIYRWNGSWFEKSDITADTGNIYATLVTNDQGTFIETGKENDPSYYTYIDGKLIGVKSE